MQNQYIAIITDISDYNIAEKKLRESQRLISTLISNLPGVIYLAEKENSRKMKFLSEGCYELTEFYPNDIIDDKETSFDNLIFEDDREFVQKELNDAVKKGSSYLMVYRITTGQKKEKWVMDKGRPIFSSDDKLIAIGGLISDITDYKKIEKDLADEKERLSITLKSIGDAVITTDTEGNVMLLNNVAENLTGWSQDEANGKNIKSVFNIIYEDTRKPYEDLVKKVLKNKRNIDLANNIVLISRNGADRIISETSTPINDNLGNIIGIVIVFRDITEKNKIDEEMRKIQKLESLGVLAGGIAHDFNNLLTTILGYINLAKYSSNKEELDELLGAAEKGIYNSKNLSDQLLTFAKGGEPIKRIGSINKILKESVNFPLRGSNVSCDFNIDKDLYLLDFDEGQLNQVFNNLTINARQAMKNGGRLAIIAENIIFDDKKQMVGINPGKYIKIIFRDNGSGIPRKILPKIFDLFFTTKNNGKGLGLAIVFSIIKKHNGYIEVESKEGEGTSFIIYLPALIEKQSGLLNIPEEDVLIKGEGKILFMDDDDIIQKMTEKVLKFLGYKVDFVKDGYAAIEKIKDSIDKGDPYDCVILDITIPGSMGGKETVEKLLEIDPNIKAVVTSGYSNDKVLANYKDFGFKGAIIKPFTVKKISETLNFVINPEFKQQKS